MLRLNQLPIQSVTIDQFAVGSLFDDTSLVKDDNLVGVTNRRQSVGSDQQGSAFRKSVDCGLDGALRFGIILSQWGVRTIVSRLRVGCGVMRARACWGPWGNGAVVGRR